MASSYDIDIRQPPFNASGDGVHDDTGAFRDAIAAASSRPHGGRIYVPPGEYVLFKDPTAEPLRIEHSDITIFGDGPQSVILIQDPWREFDDTQAYFIIGRRLGG